MYTLFHTRSKSGLIKSRHSDQVVFVIVVGRVAVFALGQRLIAWHVVAPFGTATCVPLRLQDYVGRGQCLWIG